MDSFHLHGVRTATEAYSASFLFSGSKAAGAWSWSLTAIYWHVQEHVQLHLHSPTHFHRVVLNKVQKRLCRLPLSTLLSVSYRKTFIILPRRSSPYVCDIIEKYYGSLLISYSVFVRQWKQSVHNLTLWTTRPRSNAHTHLHPVTRLRMCAL
jgi:hypothetical protein